MYAGEGLGVEEAGGEEGAVVDVAEDLLLAGVVLDDPVRSMSMMGLAASPGTEVEPTCSICSARQPRAWRIRPARSSYHHGQAGSASVTSMPVAGAAPGTHEPAPGGGGESSNVTISARLGIGAVYPGPWGPEIKS
jgi:hypothetical protein